MKVPFHIYRLRTDHLKDQSSFEELSRRYRVTFVSARMECADGVVSLQNRSRYQPSYYLNCLDVKFGCSCCGPLYVFIFLNLFCTSKRFQWGSVCLLRARGKLTWCLCL